MNSQPKHQKGSLGQISQPYTALNAPRRSFLKCAGLLALAAPAAIAARPGPPGRSNAGWHRRDALRLLAEGVVPIDYVLPTPVLPPPPPETPPLEARVRTTFPLAGTKNVASVQVFLVPAGLPVLPLPEAPPLVPQSPTDPYTISYFENVVEHVLFGDSPVVGTANRLPSLMLCGRTLSNEVLSPFGDLTGAPWVLHTSYDLLDEETGETNFVFFGGAAAGNHTTVAPTAKGVLRLRGSA